MTEGMVPAKPSPGWTGWTARVLTIVVGLWWTLIGFRSGMAAGAGGAAKSVLSALFPGVALLVGVLIAWFGRKVGGAVILVVGLAASWLLVLAPALRQFQPVRFGVYVLILTVPTVLAGLLLLIGKDRAR
jgi:hypothetical protein